MDETVFNVVQLVDIVYHFLAGIVNELLNKGVSAKGNTQTDVSFSREGCEGDRVLDGCEACIILKKTFSSGVGVVGGDSFHQELGLEHVQLEASVILENLFGVSEDAKSNTKRCIDVSIVRINDCPILCMSVYDCILDEEGVVY